jgi:hypothetical protein
MGDRVTVALVDLRAKVEAALAPVADDDPQIVGSPVDAVGGSCIVIGYGEPWLENIGQAPTYSARVELTLIGGRVEPAGGIVELEALVAYAVGRLELEPIGRLVSASAPRALELAGVKYLASALVLQVVVTGA